MNDNSISLPPTPSGMDPWRQCVSCRVLKPRSQLWRVVRLAGSSRKPIIELDQGMGRSAYLCPQKSCLEEAQKRKRLERSLRTQVPAAIYTALAARLLDPGLVDQSGSES